MQSASFLSYQHALAEGGQASNCRTLFGMGAIPTDNHIRALLDPVAPVPSKSQTELMTAEPSSGVEAR